jgi:serine/threonine protein kinase
LHYLSCREQAVALALRSRRTLLQRIAQGLLQALSYCHSRGVAHCGLGPGCVVVNTWKDKEADRLLVKLDNFGLARLYDHPLEEVAEGEQAVLVQPAEASDCPGLTTYIALGRVWDKQCCLHWPATSGKYRSLSPKFVATKREGAELVPRGMPASAILTVAGHFAVDITRPGLQKHMRVSCLLTQNAAFLPFLVPVDDDDSSSSGLSRSNIEDTDGLLQRQQDLQV